MAARSSAGPARHSCPPRPFPSKSSHTRQDDASPVETGQVDRRCMARIHVLRKAPLPACPSPRQGSAEHMYLEPKSEWPAAQPRQSYVPSPMIIARRCTVEFYGRFRPWHSEHEINTARAIANRSGHRPASTSPDTNCQPQSMPVDSIVTSAAH